MAWADNTDKEVKDILMKSKACAQDKEVKDILMKSKACAQAY